jgi:hypothetical protein
MGRELRTFLSEDSYPEELVESFDDPSLMNVRPLETLYNHIYRRQEDPGIEIAFEFSCYEVKKKGGGGLLPKHPRRQLHTFEDSDLESVGYGEISMPLVGGDKSKGEYLTVAAPYTKST